MERVIRHHRADFGFGAQVLRVSSSDLFLVNLDHNVVYDNWIGVFFANLMSSDATTVAGSSGNVYRDNGAGLAIIGGRDFPFDIGSLRNQVLVNSADDAFFSNHEGGGYGWGAGIWAVAGWRDRPVVLENSGNVVSLKLFRTQFSSTTSSGRYANPRPPNATLTLSLRSLKTSWPSTPTFSCHKDLKSTNMLERLNEELRRRTRVARIFANAASCLRLTRALCVETHEGWLEDKRYLNMDVLWDARKDQLRKARAADHDGRSASTFGGVISTLAMDCIARAGPHVENSGCPAGRSSVSFSVLYNLG